MKKNLALFTLLFAFAINSFAQNNIPSYVPTNGLVGWWPFNGNANDESGNGNNGTVNGATLNTDRFGNENKSYSFDTNQLSYIKTNAIATSIYDNFTTSVWVSSNRSIVLPVEGSQSNSSNQCVIHPTHGSCFGDYNNNSGSGLYVGTNGIVVSEHSHLYVRANLVYSGNINGWHLITVVYINKQSQLYIDGLFVKSGIADSRHVHPSLGYDNTSFADYSHSGFGVGFNNTQNTSPQFFDGKIDDIAIYNRALTQQEITQLYQAQSNNNTNTDTTSSATKPVPPGIPYQAIIRNASGQIMTNANITAQFTLHKDSAIGVVEYQETHSLTTNAQGLINTTIGKGTATQGTFAGINWANTNKFLQVQINLGNGFVDLGTQQLMSVPYALYAANGPKGEKGETGAQGPQGPAGNGLRNGSFNGEMLYWRDSAWVSVSAGAQGQFLQIDSMNIPSWKSVTKHFIGENYGGGIVFYTYDNGNHGLIVSTNAPTDIYPWYNGGAYGFINVYANRNGINAGLFNTEKNIITQKPGVHAASICANYQDGNFGDWYLPSLFELNLLYLQKNIINDIYPGIYWSSNEDLNNPSHIASGINMADGSSLTLDKAYGHFIRAIRSF